MRATIELFPLIIFVSLVYSVPLLLLHFTVLYLLNRFKADPLLTKLILVTVTIAGIYITMEYLTGIKIQAWTYSYSLAAVVTGLLIRIKEE
ncbi:MAG: hypothetical protein HYZ15_08645 [Sphingobacteriales bacterium]|nr:hypothetical protein [Sphingobacteriales bacterium]